MAHVTTASNLASALDQVPDLLLDAEHRGVPLLRQQCERIESSLGTLLTESRRAESTRTESEWGLHEKEKDP